MLPNPGREGARFLALILAQRDIRPSHRSPGRGGQSVSGFAPAALVDDRPPRDPSRGHSRAGCVHRDPMLAVQDRHGIQQVRGTTCRVEGDSNGARDRIRRTANVDFDCHSVSTERRFRASTAQNRCRRCAQQLGDCLRRRPRRRAGQGDRNGCGEGEVHSELPPNGVGEREERLTHLPHNECAIKITG